MPDNNQIPQTFPEDTNIPPIPSGMVQDTSFPNPIQTITDAPPQEGNIPPGLPPIIPSGKPPKKFGGKKFIATILGILILVGAVGAGVILVGQKQLFKQKAGGTSCYCEAANCTSDCFWGTNGPHKCPDNACPVTPPECTDGQNRAADCTQVFDGQTCPGKKLEICQNGNWGGNYPCLDTADNCPSTQQDCSQVCVTDHPDGDPYCNPGGYLCQNYIGDWAKPKSCFASGSCSAPFSYSSGNYCVNTSSHCNPGPGCSATPDPSCTATTPPGATPTPGAGQWCERCSNLAGQETTWVKWYDRDGGCNSDYYNQRTETPNDPRCTGAFTPTPTPMPGYVGCGEACNDYIHCIPSLNCPGGPGGGHCVNGACPQDPDCVCNATSTPTPTGVLRACNASCQADEQCSTGYCTNAGVCRNSSCPNDTDCNCSIINTPTPGIDAVCSAVKAYDANWNLLSGAQLSVLSAGSVVRFTISGTPANQIDKARFTINGVLGPETTAKKPGTNEYYVEYTIPAGVYSFTVTAQIHHLTLGWF